MFRTKSALMAFLNYLSNEWNIRPAGFQGECVPRNKREQMNLDAAWDEMIRRFAEKSAARREA